MKTSKEAEKRLKEINSKYVSEHLGIQTSEEILDDIEDEIEWLNKKMYAEGYRDALRWTYEKKKVKK